MKKYEYKLDAYTFKVSIDLAANIERTLNKEANKSAPLRTKQIFLHICKKRLDFFSQILYT